MMIERADFLEPQQIEIYGTPSATLLEADQPLVNAGIPRSILLGLLAPQLAERTSFAAHHRQEANQVG